MIIGEKVDALALKNVDISELVLVVVLMTTVKFLYNGHHRNLKIVPGIESFPLQKGSSQISLFCFCSRV